MDGEGELIDEVGNFFNELPKAVQQTIQKQTGTATLGEIDKSNEDGEVFYDVELTGDGKTRGFTVGAKGELREIEVFMTELPDGFARLPIQNAKAGEAIAWTELKSASMMRRRSATTSRRGERRRTQPAH